MTCRSAARSNGQLNCVNLGYGPRGLIEAIQALVEQLAYVSLFYGFTHPQAVTAAPSPDPALDPMTGHAALPRREREHRMGLSFRGIRERSASADGRPPEGCLWDGPPSRPSIADDGSVKFGTSPYDPRPSLGRVCCDRVGRFALTRPPRQQ